MPIVLVLNVLLSCVTCFAVIGGLASSIVSQRSEAVQAGSGRVRLRRDATAGLVPAAEAARIGA
ncbi:MAG TPA: hypothetical protein VMB27_23015 [Solirubrobacteraceae bacterium]|nr:hypothetical protein [Solirubrobacteraceae bacterium]